MRRTVEHDLDPCSPGFLRATIPAPRPRPGWVRVDLADGGVAELRPLQDGEVAPLLAVFDGLSEGSRLFRYLAGTGRLPAAFVRRLAAVDGVHRVAWLACVDGHPAGIGRYVRSAEDPSTADLALEVVDEHQRRGLGSALLDAVTTVAEHHGVRRLQATVHPQNRGSLRLLARWGVPLSYDGGVLEGSGPLRLPELPRVDRAAVVQLALRAAAAPQGRAR